MYYNFAIFHVMSPDEMCDNATDDIVSYTKVRILQKHVSMHHRDLKKAFLLT